MKLMNQNHARLPIEDYTLALRKAFEWLGDRYLLAVPINASRAASEAPRYYNKRVQWHQGGATKAMGAVGLSSRTSRP